MRAYECPSCGAPVNFQSGATVFAVCEHCHSMVVRSDVKLEAIGKMAELPPEMSPLQIGTTGRWADKPFTLRGRVRLGWSEGSWTEWYAEFGDGAHAWIAETQGFFAISVPSISAETPGRLNELKPGQKIFLTGTTWEIVDRKVTQCEFAEGELPFIAKPGSKRTSVDLAGPKNAFASLEQSNGAIEYYVGNYAEAEDLAFGNLRPVPGWSDQPPDTIRNTSRSVACPNCGAPITLRAAGLSLSAVCGSCQTILDPQKPDVAVIQQAEAVKAELHPVLDLGIRGTFSGVPYEVIGLVVRADSFTNWSEYLLFNPWHGFLWLVTFSGHWSVVRRMLTPPFNVDLKTVSIGGKRYERFAQAQTTVQAVLGEFYWRVQRGEKSLINDYIAPPTVLSSEKYPELDEETWSIGEYYTPEQVALAFKLNARLPAAEGLYLNQPNPYVAKRSQAMRSAGFAVVLLLFLEIGFWLFRPQRELLAQTFTFSSSAAAAEEVTTEKFTVSGRAQPVHVEAAAPVSNTWVDLDYQLVNASTGETRVSESELSYYSGYDSDGAWTEGHRDRSADFAAVQPGEYFLRIAPSLDRNISAIPVSIVVRTGGLFWSNFFLCLTVLLFYPAWVLFQGMRFEQMRWAESDFPKSISPSNDD